MSKHHDESDRPAGHAPDTDQHDRDIVLGSREDVSRTVAELAGQANRSLLLHTENLEPAIFDQRPFLDAVTRLLLEHGEAGFLILIQDARKAVMERNNRLIELARRLTTQVQFRRPAPQHRGYHKTFLLADDAGYLLCPLPGRYEGEASRNNPGKVQDLQKYFMEVWEHAEPDPEMRRLYL